MNYPIPGRADVRSSHSPGDIFSVRSVSIQYRPAIDGLRAIAVLAVFIFHLKRQWLPGGFVGVDVFFVISGYLITFILLREYEQGSFSLGKFYQRRIARLFPAFFTVAAGTLIAASFVYSAQDLASCGANLVSATLSVANMKYMWQGNYFKISPDAQPFLHYWSLSVEEQFYLFFPATFLILYLKAYKYKTAILSFLCAASLVTCIALTRTKPEWAFYLLPTRAWELLAGSVLANWTASRSSARQEKFLGASLSTIGLALIATSVMKVHEGPTFPGYAAIFPVLGAVCFLGSTGGSSNWPERLLSTRPMVLIGRMSYSLYLWHWPIFSFVDYKLYLASPLVRIASKIVLSVTATAFCFFLIERPGRVFLNHPRRLRVAFAFLGSALLVFVPVGTIVRRTNYIEAGMQNIARGGIVFEQASASGSMVLMGDSNGAMYGKMVKDVAQALRLHLAVISVAAGDPLPHSSGPSPQLWLDSLTFVKREKPDVVVLVCNWATKLKGDKRRLEIAVLELKKHARQLILITQPPELPKLASRESMRNGSRPPFKEEPAERAARMESNAWVKNFQADSVTVLDIEPLFAGGDGSVRFTDNRGNLLYQDADHVSDVGAELVKINLFKALAERQIGSGR